MGFLLMSCLLFTLGVWNANVRLVRLAAVFTIIEVIANRFTVSMYAFNWELSHRVFLYWKEILVVAAIVMLEILMYRWIVNRLPVHKRHPLYDEVH